MMRAAGTMLILMHTLAGFTLAFVMFASYSFGETQYSGTLGKMPIELFMTDVKRDSQPVEAVYMYLKYNTPIVIAGFLQNRTMTLYEVDAKGKKTAALIFFEYKPDNDSLKGKWKSLTSNKEFVLSLKRVFSINLEDTTYREVLQAASLENIFFRIGVSSVTTGEEPFRSTVLRVSEVNLYEKKTGRFVQSVGVDGFYVSGMKSVSVDDYNFDGIDDFSIVETQYTGPNTSSLYFLYDPETKRYFDSEFGGLDMVFDKKSKTVLETSSSGGFVRNTVYKIQNNKLVLIEEHCYQFDNTNKGLVEVGCE